MMLAQELSKLTVQDDSHATAIPTDDNVTGTSAAAMTSPIKASGASPSGSGSELDVKKIGEAIYFKAHDEDDVFGDKKPPTMPKADAEAMAAKIKQNLQNTIINIPVVQKPPPRADRLNSPITVENAQGVLAPDACIFVANLSTSRTDQQLEQSCHATFDIFGRCIIKVRRDKHRHPFALVQYYDTQDANSAMIGARDMVVNGRTLRLEHAQARRSVILCKIDGGSPSAEEVRALLEPYGPLEKIHPTTIADARKFGLPEGMWAHFVYYLDQKDAIKMFNNSNDVYRLYVPPQPELKGRAGFPNTQARNLPRSSTDQRSIFVGNLPLDVSEEELRAVFAGFGNIRVVNVIHKPIRGGTGFNVFGFIEFYQPNEADQAADQEVDLRGQRIRVEPKEYSTRRPSRTQYSPATTPYRRQHQIHHSSPIPYNQAIPSPYNASPQIYYGTNPGNFQQIYGPMPQEMTPYHGQPYTNLFMTPPPSNRIGRNTMMYGSPNGVQYFSPIPFSGYGIGMGPINEEYEGGNVM